MSELSDCLWAHTDASVIDSMQRALAKHGIRTIRGECDGLPAIEAFSVPDDVRRKASEWFASTGPARW